jgi:hypothetical protein
VGQGKTYIVVGDVQGVAAEHYYLVREDRAFGEPPGVVGAEDGVDGRRMRVTHEGRLSLG